MAHLEPALGESHGSIFAFGFCFGLLICIADGQCGPSSGPTFECCVITFANSSFCSCWWWIWVMNFEPEFGESCFSIFAFCFC